MKLLPATRSLAVVLVALGATGAYAQRDAPATTISKSITAVGYQVGSRTRVDLKATSLVGEASGEAKVDPKRGTTKVEVKVVGLPQPGVFGSEFLTYVVWAVSLDGQANNLGEIQFNAYGWGSLTGGTPLQVFSLLVTAEPYFAARQPSELVVLENEIRRDTKGTVYAVNEYPLLKRNQYPKTGTPLALSTDPREVPLEIYEARNAVDIARSHAGGKYAGSFFMKAEASLRLAEDALARKASREEIISAAKQAVQFSEDARTLAVQRLEEERVAVELAAAAARARAEVEAEASAASEATEVRRIAEREARRQAREAQVRAEADSANFTLVCGIGLYRPRREQHNGSRTTEGPARGVDHFGGSDWPQSWNSQEVRSPNSCLLWIKR